MDAVDLTFLSFQVATSSKAISGGRVCKRTTTSLTIHEVFPCSNPKMIIRRRETLLLALGLLRCGHSFSPSHLRMPPSSTWVKKQLSHAAADNDESSELDDLFAEERKKFLENATPGLPSADSSLSSSCPNPVVGPADGCEPRKSAWLARQCVAIVGCVETCLADMSKHD